MKLPTTPTCCNYYMKLVFIREGLERYFNEHIGWDYVYYIYQCSKCGKTKLKETNTIEENE